MNNEETKDKNFTLAEGAAHPERHRKNCKRAFTLAEVLITLGIIGVVAALTIPTLISKYQKQAWVAQMQKSVNVLENGFQKMLADEGVEKLDDTQLFRSMSRDNYAYTIETSDPTFEAGLKKYFKIVSINPDYQVDIYGLNGRAVSPADSSLPGSIVFADGSMLVRTLIRHSSMRKSTAECREVKRLGGKMCGFQANIAIDVNGAQKPNTFGRDIFNFSISDDGHLYPYGGRDSALDNNKGVDLSSNRYYWRNRPQYYCGTPGNSDVTGVEGWGCAARIMENGWKMDY